MTDYVEQRFYFLWVFASLLQHSVYHFQSCLRPLASCVLCPTYWRDQRIGSHPTSYYYIAENQIIIHGEKGKDILFDSWFIYMGTKGRHCYIPNVKIISHNKKQNNCLMLFFCHKKSIIIVPHVNNFFFNKEYLKKYKHLCTLLTHSVYAKWKG